MLEGIIQYSIKHKLVILLFSMGIVGFGLYSLSKIPIGSVPDVTNNQVQIITTSRNLATEDVEKFLTYPVELEMANLPGVTEIRSTSKFGLSVVTVVFNDQMGTFLPRQLIAEKIKAAEEKIPAGFGKPFMGPITTGLGEIYQYIIEVDSAYQSDYSLSDIRTIQDWVIRRQLSGIPGVVEVNTWGGYLKQYEVAINPSKLRSLNISIAETYSALKKNNSLAGGGYIEKTNQTYFIRSEGLVNSLTDIENIVIKNRNGIPIFVKDVATVGFGQATRFGAITGNGEGEKVLGQVMMLKGANSKEVINAVKERVANISPSLPPGIRINAFLERSDLINKTTFTIAENLILGCLIVIFVVVLLLGNIRSGLVVASVIPLSLLFALSLMYIFGVDANLMSLGAIDFGIIIDGSVIIVEYVAFKITAERSKLLALPAHEQQGFIDQITVSGVNKMMHSAVFGQLIIIIVFIPILSLSGVEGKMFKPMALVFCFALIGAMILCFTYLPVMASLLIKPANPDKKNISTRLIQFLEKRYRPIICFALRQKGLILSLSLILLLTIAFLFTRMGGEFVPTLDEGDFVIQPVLKTGTSLTNTVTATTNMEKILKKFPEVLQIVSRIGAAEVPTDPMSMEESDVIIKLKPKDTWVSAQSKDELANVFKEALSAEIPGVDFEFTQPIEMRFNELITGVRADVAIKVFGENLNTLSKKAMEIENAIQGISGASDISVEKITGLPQMSVKYDRQKIAKYGVNIEDLNAIISMGFAGLSAGMVFEGEKQFDLVIRFDTAHHQDIADIKLATIQLPNGSYLPLSELATITYTKGPAKISRDDTKRRIVIGVNVRNRDLESVVQDIQQAISKEITLPTGYTIEYGGQFENLRTAKARLLIAVPIALVLIFVLLYFAFNSIRQSLLIYTAIPMSAIGGVALLYLRGLPFSISAGVGFIALFGIAVLNGIVLIEEFKELKANGVSNINRRILIGTKNRLRPVLLTASAAALGFLPMAISTSAGAEVQRPLATVVVGGLFSATLLTLIVLPVLYALFDKKYNTISKTALSLLLVCLVPTIGQSQNTSITVQQAIDLALENNLELEAAEQRIEKSRQQVGTAIDIPKTELFYARDENNIAPNNLTLNVFGVSQRFQLPSVYRAQKAIMEERIGLKQNQYLIDKNSLTQEVHLTCTAIQYWQNMLLNYQYLDSLYQSFEYVANRRFDQGETNYLEKLTAETKRNEVSTQLKKIKENIQKNHLVLNLYLQTDSIYNIISEPYKKMSLDLIDTTSNPILKYFESAINVSHKTEVLEKQKKLPELQTDLFMGVNNGTGRNTYGGFQLGVAVPIWAKTYKAALNTAKIETQILKIERNHYKTSLLTKRKALLSELKQHELEFDFYEKNGKTLAAETLIHAEKAYKNGAINFLQYTQFLEQAKSIELRYLKSLFEYNKTVLKANYLLKL